MRYECGARELDASETVRQSYASLLAQGSRRIRFGAVGANATHPTSCTKRPQSSLTAPSSSVSRPTSMLFSRRESAIPPAAALRILASFSSSLVRSRSLLSSPFSFARVRQRSALCTVWSYREGRTGERFGVGCVGRGGFGSFRRRIYSREYGFALVLVLSPVPTV